MLRILGKSSSINVRKVLWTCAEIGLPYTLEQYGTGFESTDTAWFRGLNPNATVPLILDGGTTLWESNTICRYLAASHGREDLLPADPAARAQVEKWMDWQAQELNGAWRYAFMALVRSSPAHQDRAAITASIEQWQRHMRILDAELEKTGAYANGAQFSLADIVLGLSTHRWLSAPIERPHLAAVEAYYARLSTRPAFLAHGRNRMP